MVKKSPFRCHIFVCVNDRQGARKSCADGRGAEIRQILKDRFQKMDLPPDSIRVSQSLCMGLCNEGPNLMIYPQGIWYSAVKLEDIDTIVKEVEALSTQPEQ
ncbi:(2Fe-2S) ferredoxin domain-containing protein [Geopsychrobacter electrodiphilus]|uniref:(2Fe-2S) ferredoxin domain-containing protein n=1 Tax=Geopsychrobacter electrodiphilus TaxID=225196 RepID=UPI00036302BB|nr:(2Fe-2S) ferredoxin domain-containing protein [Geopsychrobacter electrodiphilus]